MKRGAPVPTRFAARWALAAALAASAPAARADPADGVGVLAPDCGYLRLWAELDDDEPPRGLHAGGDRRAFGLPDRPVAADLDGDGLDGVGVYEPGTGLVHHLEGPGPARTLELGLGVLPVAGDWDGDGDDELAGYDPAAGRLYLGAGRPSVALGPPGGLPLAGDWDGDGRDGLGVYDPAAGRFHLRRSGGRRLDPFPFGPPGGGAPLAGDWDGDGRDGLGLLTGRTLRLRETADPGPPDRRVEVGPEGLALSPLAGRWDLEALPAASDGYAWPRARPRAVGLDARRLDAAVAAARDLPRVHALLVLRRGRLAREAYFRGFSADLAGNVKSVSKSLLSALVGVALREVHLPGADARLEDLLPSGRRPADGRADAITVDDLLTMRAGLVWDEASLGPWLRRPDWVAAVLSARRVAPPGERFVYSTGLTHVAAAVLAAATGESPRRYAERHLFEPLGIACPRWDVDPQGLHVGGAEVFLRPRDMARFGQLYLQGGTLDGEAVVPAEWVARTTAARVRVEPGLDYGGWWWRRRLGGVEAVFAWGYGGQFVFVFEELDMVVVVTSRWTVDGATARDQYAAVFDLVAEHVVPAAQ